MGWQPLDSAVQWERRILWVMEPVTERNQTGLLPVSALHSAHCALPRSSVLSAHRGLPVTCQSWSRSFSKLFIYPKLRPIFECVNRLDKLSLDTFDIWILRLWTNSSWITTCARRRGHAGASHSEKSQPRHRDVKLQPITVRGCEALANHSAGVCASTR